MENTQDLFDFTSYSKSRFLCVLKATFSKNEAIHDGRDACHGLSDVNY